MTVTKADAARLLALAAAYDRRTTSDIDDAAWAAALSDLDPDECAAAIRAHYRESTAWLMPAHVRQLAREQRRARAAAIREAETHREIEAGQSFDAESSRKAFERFMKPVLDKIGSRTRRADADEKAARDVRCSYCRADVGYPCVNNGQARDVAHPGRYDFAALVARAKAHAAPRPKEAS